MVHYCCVPQCSSKFGEVGVKFHAVPSNPKLRLKWKINLKTAKPLTNTMKVCSKHFVVTDYLPTCTGNLLKLKAGCIPSQCLPVLSHQRRSNIHLRRGREERCQRRSQLKIVPAPKKRRLNMQDVRAFEESNEIQVNEGELPKEEELFVSRGMQTEEIRSESKSVQTEGEEDKKETASQTYEDKKETASQTYSVMRFGQYIMESSLNDDELKYLTGLSRQQFEALYSFVHRSSCDFPVSPMCAKDQLLFTLIKYKLNLDYVLLSIMFRVDRRSFGNIFRFWTNLMYGEFKEIDLWSLRLKGDGLYTVIIDCTEIPIERSSNPEMHQQTFSNYKNGPTFKGLVGIDELGNPIYVSELHGGSISDRKIVEISGFLDLLEEGDIVLADRGFTISDLLEQKGAALNIPPFRDLGAAQFKESEVMYTRHIARRRIHIERVIGEGKIHQILKEVMPEHLWPIASQIFFNCMMLCTLKPGIVTLKK